MIKIYENEQVDCIINLDEKIQKLHIKSFVQEDIYKINIGVDEIKDMSSKDIKSIFAKAIKEAVKNELYNICIDLNKYLDIFGLNGLWHIVEGINLALYEKPNYKSDYIKKQYNVYLKNIKNELQSTSKEIIEQATNLTEGIIFARNIVNEPANKLTPEIMAKRINKLFEGLDVECEILDEKEISNLNMEAFLTVGQSSGKLPRLIVLRYMGNKDSNEVFGLIGKGVTCDTGGYCLKPSSSMLGIKGDMAGAAAVSGSLYALAKNNVKTNAVVVIPACENRISRESFIPGDVISSMAGKTIEIANTDAEGRLILADAVTYAIRKEKVTKVLDIATLTGAVVAMFGFTTAGVLCNDEELYRKFQEAYLFSGEQYYRLPMYEEYSNMIKSDIADIRNMGNKGCSTITAGLFIKEFTEGLPWIHIDIAGTAWVDSPEFEYQSIGATGAAVNTIYFMLNK